MIACLPSTRRDELRRLFHRIEDRGAAAGSNRLDRIRYRRAIVRRSGDRLELLVERRDDDPILLAQKAGQTSGGVADEIDAPRHALAAVDQDGERRGQLLGTHHVQRLRHVVLEQLKGRWPHAGDEAAALVLHGGLDVDAGHLRVLDHLQRFQQHAVIGGVAAGVHGLCANLSGLERVLVGPVDAPGRSLLRLAEQDVVHEEPHRGHRRVRCGIDLSDDANRAGRPSAAERRGDADRERRGFSEGDWGQAPICRTIWACPQDGGACPQSSQGGCRAEQYTYPIHHACGWSVDISSVVSSTK